MNIKRRITAIGLICSLMVLIFGGQSPATVMADDTKIVEAVNHSGPIGVTVAHGIVGKIGILTKDILSWDLGKQHYGGIKNIMKHGGWESKIKTET